MSKPSIEIRRDLAENLEIICQANDFRYAEKTYIPCTEDFQQVLKRLLDPHFAEAQKLPDDKLSVPVIAVYKEMVEKPVNLDREVKFNAKLV